MKQRMIISLAILLLTAWAAGCGADDTVYLEQIESGTPDFTEDTEKSSGDGSAEAGTEEMAQKAAENTGASDDADAVTAERGQAAGQETEECYVYVCGAVCAPGVYILEPGSRIYEAVVMAGGLTEDASAASVNQAELVCDGQMIFIPTEEEAATGIAPMEETARGMTGQEVPEAGDARIDLNTASAAELMTLPGIGETKAESILAYREKHGGFSSVEEIMQVDGIKEGLYNRIKDDIRVK